MVYRLEKYFGIVNIFPRTEVIYTTIPYMSDRTSIFMKLQECHGCTHLLFRLVLVPSIKGIIGIVQSLLEVIIGKFTLIIGYLIQNILTHS